MFCLNVYERECLGSVEVSEVIGSYGTGVKESRDLLRGCSELNPDHFQEQQSVLNH